MSYHEFTTEIEEAEVIIRFNYQPEEPMVMYYADGSGYPGCPEAIESVEVDWMTKRFNKETRKREPFALDVTEFLEDMGYDLDQMCFDHLENEYS